jgi:MtN3 and saliva related transmembrane protein
MVESALAVGAASWGVIMAVSPVLQIIRVVRRRSSEDLSISYFMVLIVGFALWLAYGISIRNAVLIVPNSVALIVGVTTIVVAASYRSGHDRAGRPPSQPISSPDARGAAP